MLPVHFLDAECSLLTPDGNIGTDRRGRICGLFHGSASVPVVVWVASDPKLSLGSVLQMWAEWEDRRPLGLETCPSAGAQGVSGPRAVQAGPSEP